MWSELERKNIRSLLRVISASSFFYTDHNFPQNISFKYFYLPKIRTIMSMHTLIVLNSHRVVPLGWVVLTRSRACALTGCLLPYLYMRVVHLQLRLQQRMYGRDHPKSKPTTLSFTSLSHNVLPKNIMIKMTMFLEGCHESFHTLRHVQLSEQIDDHADCSVCPAKSLHCYGMSKG